MTLIIDIDEYDYNNITEQVKNNDYPDMHIGRSIVNGIRAERPTVILYGQAIYITQGHIDAMIEYERKQKEKEFIDNFMKGLNDERT